MEITKSEEKNTEDPVSFTHAELLEITSKTLSDLISRDTFLNDLPPDPTNGEVAAQLALQYGQSITVVVIKGNGEKLSVVVNHGATVIALKNAIQRHVMLQLKRRGVKTKVSWRYVWKSNYLQHDTTPLTNDMALLSDYSISNGSRVTFVKRLRQKNSIKYSKTKHRNLHADLT